MYQRLYQSLVAPSHSMLLQVPRALVASVLALMLDFGTLTLLVEFAGWRAVPAAVLSYLLGGVVQYVLCLYWVFPYAPSNKSNGFIAFTVLSLVGLAITWLVMAGLHERLGLNYAFTKTLAVGLAFTWNFLSRKYFLFRPAVHHQPGF